MRRLAHSIALSLFLVAPLLAQSKRLWVLRPAGEMVEYDPESFAVKQTVKVPAEALQTPLGLSVNHAGQILFVPIVGLPLSADDVQSEHRVWFWNGHEAAMLPQGVKREVTATGSNQAISEVAPTLRLAADGTHLFWFANEAHRLQRDGLDLSTTNQWEAWRTDLAGGAREELVALKIPECKCATGSCEETCAYCGAWAPDQGVRKFLLVTQFVTGQTETTYQKSALYRDQGGSWTATALEKPLERELDASVAGDMIVEAIPDAGCCGWSNESDDQTLVRTSGKTRIVFDELESYQNPDYDVSFYTSNALLSPELGYVAMTIVSTAEANKPIQLADEGQANPEESQRIRKALTELPAVEAESNVDAPKRVALVPHAELVGWLNEKEILIVEDHLLVVYDIRTGTRRKSNVRVEDASRVFLR